MSATEIAPRVPFSIPHVLSILLLLLGTTLSTQARASDLGLTEADCRCCHGASLADRHHLMVIDRGLECLGCHQMAWNSTTLQYDMTVTRNCPQCHTGSLADRHHLLVDQVTYNCFTCHTIAWDPDTLMYVAEFNTPCNTSPPQNSVLSATINGTVNDPSGTALGWVQVTTDDGNHSAMTTDTGSFQLADIPPGIYVLTASADGYFSASQSITATEGQTLSIDIVLFPSVTPPTISGLVLDSKQKPVEGAKIFSADGLYSTLSDADGGFTLINVSIGNLTLTAERSGYGSKTQSISLASGQNLAVEFVLPDFPPEVCNDRIDNDRNGYADCTDPVCAGTAACRPPLEICGDELDNDANGLTDCGDPACMETAACAQPNLEICDDDIDNNDNNLTDCADPECSTLAHCLTELCTDGIDNNGDNLIDCEDPVCANSSKCLSPPVEICDDGLDNDADGQPDCTDDKCSSKPICAQPGNDETPNSGSCEYIVQSEWATGFTAAIRIHNKDLIPINGWDVSWKYTDNSTIRTSWNADLSGPSPYTANSRNWNALIYPGQTVEFGILGEKTPPPAAQTPLVTGPNCNTNGNLRCEYLLQGEWDQGFNAAIRLYNEGTVPIEGWQVNWEYTDGSTIDQVWSANVSGGSPYKATNLDWNKTIYPGRSIEFGIIGQKNIVNAQIPTVSGSVCDN